MAIEWLKKQRTEKFPSQTALAHAAGIKPARYSRIENGYSEMREEEIEGLAKALQLTLDEVRSGNINTTKPKVKKTKTPKGVSAASVVVEPAPKQPTVPPPISPSVTLPPAETKPGDNLEDPKNFTLMPPAQLLLIGNSNNADVRSQLQKAATFAEKVLHTSKVRPAVWVAWRDFSREAQKFLRGPIPTVVLANPKPIDIIQSPVRVSKPLPNKPIQGKPSTRGSAPRSQGNKNVFGHFVDVARESLPASTSAALNEKAVAAKTTNPEMGFMKHFRRIAEIELSPAEFDRIAQEAERRDGSRD
ncbi:MAG: helix-turn-helix transcriptional regulator [Nibricoccus sp.]